MTGFHFLFITFCVTWLAGFALPVFAGEPIAIVTARNSAINIITLESLKQVYLRKQELDSNNKRWLPVNLPSSHEMRLAVSMLLYKKQPTDMEDYWNEQYFQGINPPKVLASEEAVLRFVAITPGAIGYVRKHLVDERVKVLMMLSVPDEN
jgi:ABC-type phosphate transport system substrate-binding protein